MNTFNDKVVWITGASSGIGEALAYAFSKEGAKIILSARRPEELERVKAACTNPESHLVLPLDLSDHSNYAELANQILERYGRIDYLANNGGISQRSSAQETQMAVDRRIMEINYFGNIALAKVVLPIFAKQKKGHFIILSSLSGLFGYFERSAYCASKHALHGYYESVRLEELHNNIKVTFICPGFVRTNMSINALSADGEKHDKEDRKHNSGISADECATQILKAVRKELEIKVIGKYERFSPIVKRFFPRRFTKIMYKTKHKDA